MRNRVQGLCVLLLGALGAAGCNDMPATVSGKVSVEGKTYRGLRVSFIPEAGGATVFGQTDEDGAYALKTGSTEGLVPGEYRVTVVGFSKTPHAFMTQEEYESIRIVPAESSDRENTPHRTTVKPGSNEFNLDL